jgi:hypothetical protein
MRLVGAAVELVPEPDTAGIGWMPRDDDVLFAARFRVRPRLGTDAIAPLLAALDTELGGLLRDRRPFERRTSFREVQDRFHALEWQTLDEGSTWSGELRWAHVHPVISGLGCLTELVLTQYPGDVQLTVRVSTAGGFRSVRGTVGAGQARPRLLGVLAQATRLLAPWGSQEPRNLTATDIEEFVRGQLLDPARKYPVALLAPTETDDYLLPPDEVAAELLGLAPLYVMDRQSTTFRLSDVLGDRRLSAYWGALRLYRPDFSLGDAPGRHPVLIAERLMDPVVRAGLVGDLALRAREHVPAPIRIHQPQPTVVNPARGDAATGPPASGAGNGAKQSQAGDAAVAPPPGRADVHPSEPSPSVGRRLRELDSQLQRLSDLVEGLSNDLERFRMATAVRSSMASGLERRLSGLERLLRARLPEQPPTEPAVEEEVSSDDAPDQTLVGVVRQAADEYSDALLILPDAERSAADSPFEDVDRVAVILEAMASVARRRQAGELGTTLRDAFRAMGLDYRSGIAKSTPRRLQRQYAAELRSGVTVTCEEHLAIGVSYDPRHCLRIYFTSRAEGEARFVIAHIGRHLDVVTTT